MQHRHPLLLTWLCFLTVLGSLLCAPVHAYIPASPTNETSVSTNSSSLSHLKLQWFGGTNEQDVSYQLVEKGSNGISKVRSSDTIEILSMLLSMRR